MSFCSVNTYKELVDYAAEHGAEFTTLIGQVSTLETQLGEAKTDISELEASVGTKAEQADLTSTFERVTALEGEMDTAQPDIESLKTDKPAASDLTTLQTTVGEMDTAYKAADTALDGRITVLEEVEAEKNVIATVDETQFAIDENRHLTLLDVAMGKVTGLQVALDAKANKGTTLAEYGITDAYTKTETESRIQEVLDGLSDTSETAASVAQALETYKTANDQRVSEIETDLANKVDVEAGKSLVDDTLIAKLSAIEEGAQVNKIESVKLGENVLETVDKTVSIPVGAGLKASDEVTVAEDGTLGIGTVNVNKLVQSESETLILNGGSAV